LLLLLLLFVAVMLSYIHVAMLYVDFAADDVDPTSPKTVQTPSRPMTGQFESAQSSSM
jgi:hypothetical protein